MLTIETREDLLRYFDQGWSLTEKLFTGLQNEAAFYRPPHHQLRHPLIFYYCHPCVFYINKFRIAGIIKNPINPYFEKLFETGVDEMSWDDLTQQQTWPALQEIRDYRSRVYTMIKEIIATHPDLEKWPITPTHPFWALLMGCEHERIHLETSSVLMRELPIDCVKQPVNWPSSYPINADTQYPKNRLIEINSQEITLGKSDDDVTFGWDNEYGESKITVKKFHASQFLISNGEFFEFVVQGGYQNARFWSKEGWCWRTFNNAKWPTFWKPSGPHGLHEYHLRLCFELVPMQWSWPVIVNYYEAKAYCAWRSERDKTKIPYRLLTEAEHHCLRNSNYFSEKLNNLNLIYGSESPVNTAVFGNVWQWCEDHFAALPGFETNYLYTDFSTPCFDGKHNIIVGGSFISTGAMTSPWARFHFRRHFFQHAGFRLVQPLENTAFLATSCLNAPPPHVNNTPCCTNKYEDQQTRNQYLLLHFGNDQDILSFPLLSKLLSNETVAFPKRCAALIFEMTKKYSVPRKHVLDLGCGVGGACFELAREFQEVVGVDLSESFIQTAQILNQTGQMEFVRQEEGDRTTPLKITLDPHIDRKRIEFQIGDACNLSPNLQDFNVVLAANLLCRLTNPIACLQRMSGSLGLVKLGGLLILISPYSWLTQYTPKNSWLCDDARDSMQTLRDSLNPHFTLLEEHNIPFIIREHARKYEYIIGHATVWQRLAEEQEPRR